ncbi:hydroxymethylbilane synthase [Campylobacter pinnipediorum subsp. caledonicus]|uniref:Porphobilinogen deaminase n=1 Tax=Campylobacter pinnipediorum subsp. caledonicus TaxID=1874362 RepID=A0A1S6U6D9_9BACT|nr:hydroxymethylbilane synthase [Campylobacter pinnipediorum]AQW85697.1 hydroxymethylbilane synthase [Campylobacter pinnipediorum subsp. caledonicus]AQW87308.1 hydroxymethylbilane synthase [Campylobacter pinnipediorum subsp. caledonicus]OPA72475.1 hydroxymethylbilane synthase [Campylobacter pinnipediorum subsp. caledonicus]
MKTIKIATRKSILAMWQSEHIKQKLITQHKDLDVELVGMTTKGDVILDTPLAKIGGKGLFTKELEISMLNGDTHIAVHSLKDVPVEFPDGLVLAATCSREDVRDALISEKYKHISELPIGAKIGTTSLRRRMQLLLLRPDLKIFSLRGNVQTRLKKLKDGEFDAIILAKAGANRLNLQNDVRYITPFELDEMIPSMGQGALGIEAVNKKEIIQKIDFLNDEKTIIETKIERDFVATLQGGCQVPIGINASLQNDTIDIRAIVGMPDASKYIKDSIKVSKSEYKDIGTILANEFIKKGAKEILKQAEIMGNQI